jgi:hypothetical protein
MGPENRMALIAFGQCRLGPAMQLLDRVIAEGDANSRERALMLKVAMLREQGETAAAEALYPDLAAAWQARKDRALKERRRERDIGLFIDVVRAERRTRNLPVDCRPPAASDGPEP